MTVWRRVTLTGLTLAVCGARLGAADMTLPAETQIPLLLKALTYDRNLERKGGKELVVGIVHDPSNRESATATDAIATALYRFQNTTVKKLPLRFYTIEYTGAAEFERIAKAKGISVLYIAPGLDRHIASLLKVCRELGVTTITGVAEYMQKGVALGVGQVRDRPQVFVHLVSARSEGADFDASLLRIATIIGPRERP